MGRNIMQNGINFEITMNIIRSVLKIVTTIIISKLENQVWFNLNDIFQ